MKPRTSTPTAPYTPGEQMDRPVDSDVRRTMDDEAAALAMQSDHHALAGSAQGVGSVAFDHPGAYDVSRPGARPERHLNRDPAAVPHSDPQPDTETSRVRAGGLAPGETFPGEQDPGARMTEKRSFKRPERPQDASGQPSLAADQARQP